MKINNILLLKFKINSNNNNFLMEEEKSLFLKLEGSSRFKWNIGENEFDLKDENYPFNFKAINNIADLDYDSTFKYFFEWKDGKALLKYNINSKMIPNEEDEVIELPYINNELERIL